MEMDISAILKVRLFDMQRSLIDSKQKISNTDQCFTEVPFIGLFALFKSFKFVRIENKVSADPSKIQLTGFYPSS
jgi:hypothetical protein